MALFSDNPFVGVFRAQKRREEEDAMAQQQAKQQAKAERAQQAQQLAGKRLEQLQSIPSDIRGLEAMRRSNVAYGFGLGGSTPWTYKTTTNPQTGAITRVPTLKQGYTQVGQGASLDSRPIMAKGPTLAPAGKKVGVMGAGTAFKQEYRGIREGLERGGATVIEGPEKFVRGKGTSQKDRASQFYSEVTGRPMGSLMGRGAYGGFGKGAQPQPTQLSQGFGNLSPRQYPALTEATKITQGEMGVSGNPIGFTGFGQAARTQAAEQTVSPIGEGFGSIGSNLFGAPRYPFAGSRSAFERGAEYTTLGVPRFPFAGY
jgi:hypothetical protein